MIEEEEKVPEPHVKGKARLVDGHMKMPLDLHRINMGTYSMQEGLERRIKGLAKWRLDAEKKSRHSAQECKVCYYIRGPMVAGQSFSDRPCKNTDCDELSGHSNTDVPDYCRECATKYGICRRCGGDQEGKERKSLKPPKRALDQPTWDEICTKRLGEEIKALRKKKLPWEEFQTNLDAIMKRYGMKV